MALPKICNRAIWMDHGRMIEEGPIDEVIAAYKATVAPGLAA